MKKSGQTTSNGIPQDRREEWFPFLLSGRPQLCETPLLKDCPDASVTHVSWTLPIPSKLELAKPYFMLYSLQVLVSVCVDFVLA